MSQLPRPLPVTSTRMLITLGQWVLDQLVDGNPCPVCKREAGAHNDGCFAGLALELDPFVRRRIAARAEGRHG